MNPILETISNNVSALPVVNSVAQPAPAPRGAGGFASALAAVQGLSSASSAATLSVPGGDTAATNLNQRVGSNLQPRKPLSSASAVANNAVPVSGVLAASPMAWPELQTNPSQSLLEVTSFQNSGVAVESVLSTAGQGSVLNPPANFLAPGITAEAVGAVANPSVNVLTPNQLSGPSNGQEVVPTGIAGLATKGSTLNEPTSFLTPGSPGEPVGGVATPFTTDVLQPSQIDGQFNSPEQLPASGANFAVVHSPAAQLNSNVSLSNAVQGGPTNKLASTGLTSVVENTKPSAPFLANVPQSAETILSTTSDIQGCRTQAYDLAPVPAQSAPQVFQEEVNSTAVAPVLLAKVFPQGGPLEGSLSVLNANPQIGQANVEQTSNVLAPTPSPVSENDVQPPAEIGRLFSEIVSAPNAASALVNSQGQAPGSAALRSAVAKVTEGVPATVVGGEAQGPSSIPTSALTTFQGISGLPTTSQTPFSVFFSSPGPSTESAASALPKMILPVATAANHQGYTSATGASGAGSPTAGWQSGAVQPVPPQATKDSLSESPGGKPQAGQPSRAEPPQANPPAVTAQVTVTAPSALLTLNPVAVIVPAQSGLPADSLPKPNILPSGAAGNGATLVQAAPQALPTAFPGPVQVAQLVNRIGQSEMRVGMNTSAFGNVEVRTVIHASDVGLVIGSEKGDLRGLLANDIPAITNTLQQQNLRLNNVSFMQGFASSSNSSGGDSQQRFFAPAPSPTSLVSSEAQRDDAVEVQLAGAYSNAGNSLSILA